jgi:hypothetical protein
VDGCLVPIDLEEVIWNVYHSVCFWSVHWEFGVESLSRLSSLESLLAIESQVQRWRLVCSVVGHSVVQAKGSFDFLSTLNPVCNWINSSSNVLFFADTSRISIIYKTVTLLGWV